MHCSDRRGFLGMAAVAACMSSTASVALAAKASKLVFGVISPRAVEQTRNNWWPFVRRLGLAVGQPVDLVVYEGQEQLVTAFKANQVDVGWMGNVPALDVVESGAGSVFAQMVTKDGSSGYRSQIIVNRQASGLGSLDDVLASSRRLRFSDGDPKSTSGFLVPLYFAFQKRGISDVGAVFSHYEAGNHQSNLKRVATGAVDVATCNNEELEFFAKDFPDLSNRIKVVWESPVIPQSPLVWRVGLSLPLKKRIKDFVLEFGGNSAEERDILAQVNGLSRFRESSNRQLVPIADLEMFKARQAINNDPALGAEERTRQVQAVIARGSRLELRLKLLSL
jgi:phosphonate transport system substrate-binding protein